MHVMVLVFHDVRLPLCDYLQVACSFFMLKVVLPSRVFNNFFTIYALVRQSVTSREIVCWSPLAMGHERTCPKLPILRTLLQHIPFINSPFSFCIYLPHSASNHHHILSLLGKSSVTPPLEMGQESTCGLFPVLITLPLHMSNNL